MTVEREKWTSLLFESIDNQDTETFTAIVADADDVLFRFGNAEPMRGNTAVSDAVKGFFASIQSS